MCTCWKQNVVVKLYCIFNNVCDSVCHSRETHSTFFAQSGGWLSVINAQLAMIVHMITTLNNLEAVVKEVTRFIGEQTLILVMNSW